MTLLYTSFLTELAPNTIDTERVGSRMKIRFFTHSYFVTCSLGGVRGGEGSTKIMIQFTIQMKDKIGKCMRTSLLTLSPFLFICISN